MPSLKYKVRRSSAPLRFRDGDSCLQANMVDLLYFHPCQHAPGLMLLHIGLQDCSHHTFPLLGFMSSTEMVSDTLLPPWVVLHCGVHSRQWTSPDLRGAVRLRV